MNKVEFEEYFKLYYSQVLGYTIKKVSNVYQAEDLVMDAFLSCYKKINEYNPDKASFATWIYVVINNKIKNYYRDNKMCDDLSEIDIFNDGFENDIVAAQYISELRGEIANALETLNEVQKKILILKFFKNKNATEIAKLCDMTAVNVRANISRGLNKLRNYFNSSNIKLEI